MLSYAKFTIIKISHRVSAYNIHSIAESVNSRGSVKGGYSAVAGWRSKVMRVGGWYLEHVLSRRHTIPNFYALQTLSIIFSHIQAFGAMKCFIIGLDGFIMNHYVREMIALLPAPSLSS